MELIEPTLIHGAGTTLQEPIGRKDTLFFGKQPYFPFNFFPAPRTAFVPAGLHRPFRASVWGPVRRLAGGSRQKRRPND